MKDKHMTNSDQVYREISAEKLIARIYKDRAVMGEAAAAMVCGRINGLLVQQEFVNIIFAAAPSQNEFLAALTRNETVDWRKVNAFHMDEYIGLPENDAPTFASFLHERVFGRLPFNTVNYLKGNAADVNAECKRYADLLNEYPTDIVCMGIGENGHIAFNDPHVADFNDPNLVKVVSLDAECRQQQVNDQCFSILNDVPKHAITLTIPALMAGRYLYSMVPGLRKAQAAFNTLNAAINEECPATILRRHADAVLFLDEDSGGLF
jgi:glucosamine-6-phosphate deaminase